MKNVFTLTVILFSLLVTAQSQYEKGMEKAMKLWGEGKIVEASNLLERIAVAEDDNWIPYYYVAMVNTSASFGEKDDTKLKQQLDKAKEFVDIAKNLSPDNAELLILEAMTNTAWIAFDGATYGMTLSGKNTQLYAKAMQLAPENPRVVLSKTEWDMGSARYFGKDTAPYCLDIEKAVELFTTFKPSEEPYYPDWGAERAQEVLAECKA
ncbi:hypothetical protein GCM10011414_17240 [Croceivirga lutea]|uniref:hypothetical protein n=1 Tax=Croceivirga lutea TaxID=1775167 RepID=UPI001639C86D|nr:hypothetical protein [Croceivirga lutea]GGG48045.1 hypothetical protein GCM10011414_17240 [Croceivirga lutea]